MSISAESLSKFYNDPNKIDADPSLPLTDLHRQHVALVLDLFQGHGTMTKIENGFVEDAVYEDPVAYAKNRMEVAGQLLHIPTVTSSTHTHLAKIASLTPSVQTTTGSNRSVTADEIHVDFKHDLVFKIGPTYHLETTLVVFSTKEGIVRFQDRKSESIPDNGLMMALRKLNGIIAPKVAGVPRDQKEDAEWAAANEKKMNQ
ncbi:hypothetical protein IAR55_003647 [Kwoniella newhampshirensis]|uniref:Uncharacterized protein n=1 Tax=Kwoniella newhampshirensis TaxID=1651941 RepID=A0AAW0YXA0_9TREE